MKTLFPNKIEDSSIKLNEADPLVKVEGKNWLTGELSIYEALYRYRFPLEKDSNIEGTDLFNLSEILEEIRSDYPDNKLHFYTLDFMEGYENPLTPEGPKIKELRICVLRNV